MLWPNIKNNKDNPSIKKLFYKYILIIYFLSFMSAPSKYTAVFILKPISKIKIIRGRVKLNVSN